MKVAKIGSIAVRCAAVMVLVTLVFGVAARSAEFKSGEQVVIESGQTVEDDLYMTGDTMIVKGRVRGDVVAAGRVIRVEGTVEGDLVAAAQVVVISGEVLDDVRIAGMTLKLASGGRIGDDLFTAGFSFESEPGSEAGGKTGMTGYQALVAGEHNQGLEASLVALQIEGGIEGDVKASVESQAGPAWWTRYMQSPVPFPSVAPGLTLGPEARIKGDLTYVSAGPASIDSGAQVSGTTAHEVRSVEPDPRPTATERVIHAGRRFIVLFLVGSALFWLTPEKIDALAEVMTARPLVSFGWGVVTLFAFPVAMILVLVLTLVLTMVFGLLTLKQLAALFLVVGLVSEILLAAKFWIAVLFLVPAVVAYTGGRWLLGRVRAGEWSRYSGLAFGLLILLAISFIPIAGSILSGLVVVLGLGAASLWSVGTLRRWQP